MKKIISIICLLSMLCLTACSSTEQEEIPVNGTFEYLNKISQGFYVRNGNVKEIKNEQGELTGYDESEVSTSPLLSMTHKTFTKSANKPENQRIIWLKEEYADMPTLKYGDSLILYTTGDFDEVFTIERFEDTGYTIGVCNLRVSPTGRYRISTKLDDNCTYAGGDTDVVLAYANTEEKNQYLTINTIGGKKIRYIKPEPKEEELPEEPAENTETETNECITDDTAATVAQGKTESVNVEKTEEGDIVTPEESEIENIFTRCGTIKGLQPYAVYSVDTYQGTVKNTYNWKADYRAFASMEVLKVTDFEFESDTIIKINLPEWLRSGYYTINNKGMFRYMADGEEFKESVTQIDENNYTDNDEIREKMNIPNEVPEEEAKEMTENGTFSQVDAIKGEEPAQPVADVTPVPGSAVENSTYKFEVTKIGNVKVDVTLTYPDHDPSEARDGIPQVTAMITRPGNSTAGFAMDSTLEGDWGELHKTFTAFETGTYSILFYDLWGREPHISVEYQDDQATDLIGG